MDATVIRPLGEICEILDSKRKPITKRDRKPGPYPYYGATGVLDHVEDYIFDEKLVLIGEDGAKWGAGENTAFIVEGKYWVNNHAHVIRPHRDVVDDQWLIYQLNANDLIPFISGMTVPKLNQGRLREIPISLPPLSEQKRIVAILDAAFEGIDTAIANAEQSVANARALFESIRNGIFGRGQEGWVEKPLSDVCSIRSKLVDPRDTAYIDLPHIGAGNMVALTGELIEIKTAREENLKSGKYEFDESMVLYSKIRPYLMKASRPNFAGLCSADVYPLAPSLDQLDKDFLFHMLMSREFTNYAVSGSDRAGMPKVNRDHLFKCRLHLPPIAEQRKLAAYLDEVSVLTGELVEIYKKKIRCFEALKQSLLRKAFTGTLTAVPEAALNDAEAKVVAIDTKSAEFAAGVLAIGYQRHAANRRERTFGRVKAQKVLHLVESIGGVDLGRVPMKDAAGPNDFQHMLRAENWAKTNQFFEFVGCGKGYEFRKRANFAGMIESARTFTKLYRERLDRVLDLLVWMDSRQAEVFATVHAAWNNLLLDGLEVTDEVIIQEARENWHEKKRKIPVSEFRDAIRLIERKGLVPTGDGKRVGERQLF